MRLTGGEDVRVNPVKRHGEAVHQRPQKCFVSRVYCRCCILQQDTLHVFTVSIISRHLDIPCESCRNVTLITDGLTDPDYLFRYCSFEQSRSAGSPDISATTLCNTTTTVRRYFTGLDAFFQGCPAQRDHFDEF